MQKHFALSVATSDMESNRAFDRFRKDTEQYFSRWGEFCFDHPRWLIGGTVFMLAFFSSYLPNMRTNLSSESYLRQDDPARLTFKRFQHEWGRDDRIVLVVESDQDILNESMLRKLRDFHSTLENFPQVTKVESLINARLTLGEGDELIVRDLFEQWPETPDDLAQLKTLIYSRSLYRDNFIADNGRSTILVVTPDAFKAELTGANTAVSEEEFDFEDAFEEEALPESSVAAHDNSDLLPDEELFALIDKIIAFSEAQSKDGVQIRLSGPSYLTHQLTVILLRDMSLYAGLGMLVTASLLMLVFRRWIMVVLPVAVAMLAVHLSFALMCFFDMVITSVTQILPSLLLAVGVGNSVHIFSVFFQALDRGQPKREALAYAMGHSGLAVVLTGLTTAGGLASFVTADMKAVADIGIVAPMGIFSALLFSLVLLPALISVTKFKEQGIRSDENSPLQKFLGYCAYLSTQHTRKVIAAWALLICLSLWLASGLGPSHNPLLWFPPEHDIRDTMEEVNEQYKGSTYLEIVIDSGKPNGLHEPKLLHAIDRAIQEARTIEVNGVVAGPTISLLNVNKELHQALNSNQPAFYQIPDSRELIAQELLLFENSGSDDLQDLTDSHFQKLRITAKLPFVDSLYYQPYLDVIQKHFDDIIGEQAEVVLTGTTPIFATTMGYIISDTVRAYLLAFAVIAPLMMILVGSVRVGLISMIPNLAPIIITLALMQVMGYPLDMFSTLIGSIALGLAVDDTIHFMHNYQRYHAQLGNAEKAVQETLRTTGKALMVTTLVLVGGFMVNAAGFMVNIQQFGILTATCISLAFLADVLLAPALVTLLAEWKSSDTGKDSAPLSVA